MSGQVFISYSRYDAEFTRSLRKKLEEQGIWVDYATVTPNDFQTALAGEPGNYFKRSLGDPRRTSIRYIEEAHSAFGRANSRESGGVERQQRTLIDTSNIVLDEIINGSRDCLLIATTDQPERFDPAIYRRFVEKGKIININTADWTELVDLPRIGEKTRSSQSFFRDLVVTLWRLLCPLHSATTVGSGHCLFGHCLAL